MQETDKITQIAITRNLILHIYKTETGLYKILMLRDEKGVVLNAMFGYPHKDVPRKALDIAHDILCLNARATDVITLIKTRLSTRETEALQEIKSKYDNAADKGICHINENKNNEPFTKIIHTPVAEISVVQSQEPGYPGISVEIRQNGVYISGLVLQYDPSKATIELMAWTPDAAAENSDPDICKEMAETKMLIYDSEPDISDNALEAMRESLPDGMTWSKNDLMEKAQEDVSIWLDDEISNLSRKAIPEGKLLVVFADLGLWDKSTKYRKYTILDGHNDLSAILTANTFMDRFELYADKEDVRARAYHHDGTNLYLYRFINNSDVETLIKTFDKDDDSWEASIALTQSILPAVADVYGWTFQKKETSYGDA